MVPGMSTLLLLLGISATAAAYLLPKYGISKEAFSTNPAHCSGLGFTPFNT